MKEAWEGIPILNGLYEISSKGRIRSWVKPGGYKSDTPRILKQAISLFGYNRICIRVEGKRTQFFVHRLVSESFIPNPRNKPFVNHINGVKTDNRVENLEWVTHQENVNHAKKNGLLRRGEKSPKAKLTRKEVVEIRHKYKKGVDPKKLAKRYGISLGYVWKVAKKWSWKHVKEDDYQKEIA